ncbi:Fe-Mn family superoxide dismutase [bacterium]|nr:Fe-Mn family superoxide dismutase [bacterium]
MRKRFFFVTVSCFVFLTWIGCNSQSNIENPLASAVSITSATQVTAAAAPTRCEILGFSMGPQPADVSNRPEKVRVEWEAMASTSLDCPGQQILGVDVWEHAYYLIPIDQANQGGGHLNGRAEVELQIASSETRFVGRVEGMVSCANQECQLDLEMNATSPEGMRLFLHQMGVMEMNGGGGAVIGLDIVEGFLIK